MVHEPCKVEPFEKPFESAALAGAMVAFVEVRGMGCERCSTRVRNALNKLDRVILADVFLGKGVAAVAYDPAHVLPQRLLQAVEDAGRDGRHRYGAAILWIVRARNAVSVADEGRVWIHPAVHSLPVAGRSSGFGAEHVRSPGGS